MIGKCSIKPLVLLLTCCFVWAFCLTACKQIPEKTDEYPVGELPPAQSGEAAESPQAPETLQGQIARESVEETDEVLETEEASVNEMSDEEAPEEEAPGVDDEETAVAEQPGEADEEEPEIVLPEPVPAPDLQQITEIPQLAEVPQLAVEPNREDESAVKPDAIPPVTQTQDTQPARPAQPSPPPPVPEFIRPSEPAVSEESAEAGPPPGSVFALPSRPAPSPDDNLVYSRTVTAYVGQYIEIPFRGPGWVYLGELGSRRGVYYDSRRIDGEGMVFVFRANEEGSYSLKFNRQDFIRDYVINDYVQVKVLPPPEITGSVWHSTAVVPDRVYAGPRWPPADEDPSLAGTNPADASPPDSSRPAIASDLPETAGQAAVQSTPGLSETAGQVTQPTPTTQAATQPRPASAQPVPATQPESATQPAAQGEAAPETANSAGEAAGLAVLPDAYLAKAKAEYDAGRIAGALETLDQFRAAYPGGSDEAYWLYGQALEASGPNRDIRLALDYYRRLTREYPQSSRYDAARRRIAYLERFYFNIQ
jgi:hypothetical protein